MTTDWFRNTAWDASVERAFDQKLRRARRKEQYLRIQASTLARSHPDVALRLLDRYFELPDDFDHAPAHVDRATALLALRRIDEAIASFEAALAREAVFPNVQTHARLELPFLIATLGITDRYARALEILAASEKTLVFPVERFRWHAARSLIAAGSSDAAGAKVHAQHALAAAAEEHSGFQYHPSVGLVTEEYDALIRRLQAY